MSEGSIAAFLFGNVGEDGRLEDNFLDDDAVERLGNLETVLLDGSGLQGESQPRNEDASSDHSPRDRISGGTGEMVDYSEISELAPDDSEEAGPGPSSDRWGNDSDADDEDMIEENPLIRMVPEEFRGADARDYFPEFRRNKVLRFSRLFGPGKPTSQPQIWRQVKSTRKKIMDKQKGGETEKPSTSSEGIQLDLAPTPPPEECATDDEMQLKKPEEGVGARGTDYNAGKERSKGNEGNDLFKAWRFGPAQLWYDMMGVPETETKLDYGIKLKKDPEPRPKADFPREAFLPVNFTRWEDDIIWDGEDVREKVFKKYEKGKQPICGWIPTQQTRTFQTFMQSLSGGDFANSLMKGSGKAASGTSGAESKLSRDGARQSSSIFPLDNQELRYTRWEDDIIWDTDNMDKIPEPKILTLDIYDDPKLFGLQEDKSKEDSDGSSGSPSKQYDRKDHQFTKKSQMILGQLERRKREEEEEEMESNMGQTTEKDPFNLSNDEYYLPKGTTSHHIAVGGAGSMIQHSIPAQNIMRPFFPTHLSAYRLRHFYRAPMKKARGALAKPLLYPISSLERYALEKECLREEQRSAMGGGEVFFMRDPEDLSGKDGELVLCEFSEQHPPIMQQPGMACKIRNFYKRKAGKESHVSFKYGETAFTHSSPFLGSLSPGESLQALESSLYRAPIYSHSLRTTDFLVIRTKQGFFLRKLNTVFTVGQLCPLYEVPSPNSKRATHFVRDFLLAFIYRLFWASSHEPRRLRMEDVRLAFPHYAESSVRKRLKQCADYKRPGPGQEASYWVLRSDFRLPSKEEVMSMVSPEMCCAHYSMLEAEQRLKDAGYGEKYFFAPEEEEEGDPDQVSMEDEIKCAPWNTTRAFLSATKGKCLLDQTGIADPTGCGGGFSYVRVSAKPPKVKEDTPVHPRRLVTGTDADLRKLPLKDAREMLRGVGVKEDEIQRLSRWEIIDVIRTLSTQQAKLNSDFSGMGKFARGNIRFNLAEMQERYRQDCQRIFDQQNKTLASDEVLSTDDESSAEDSDIDEMEKDIESMLTGDSSSAKKLAKDNEEKELEELNRLLHSGENLSDTKGKDKSGNEDTSKDESPLGRGRKLKICRTYRTKDGQEYTKTEEIRRDQLIEAYVKIRTTKDDAFIRAFAQMDEEYKEERRREKRRLQDRLRRIKRNEARGKIGSKDKAGSPRKPPPPPKPSLLKIHCSACNGTGHMKTNKNCPLYGKSVKQSSLQIAQTDEQLAEEMSVPAGELISVDGTKVKFKKVLVEHAEKMKKKALKLRFPKSVVRNQASRADSSNPSTSDSHNESLDSAPKTPIQPLKLNIPMIRKQVASARKYGPNSEYLVEARNKSIQRRRADPRVTFSVILESILAEMKEHPGAVHFLEPVNPRKVTDYYNIVSNPMDLRKLKANISSNMYDTREAFLADARFLMENSRLYNGDQSDITQAAREIFALASRRLAEKEQKLMRLERAINPLLDDNDIVAFSYLLTKILQECKNVKKSFAFHQPVDGKKFKTYYEKISHAMDLGTMEMKLKKHVYTTSDAFIKDLEQIVENSRLFNGPQSLYTKKAEEIRDVGVKLVKSEEEQLMEYERNIQKALDAVETESVTTGPSSVAGDRETSVCEDFPEEDTQEYREVPLSESIIDLPTDPSEGEIVEDSDESRYPVDFSKLQEELLEEGGGAKSDEDFARENGEADDSYDPLAEFMEGYQEGAENEPEMNRSGRLLADLAMSDSDSEEEGEIKRPRMDDDDADFSSAL